MAMAMAMASGSLGDVCFSSKDIDEFRAVHFESRNLLRH